MTLEEIHYIAKAMEFSSNSKAFNDLLYEVLVFAVDLLQIKLDLPLDSIYKINNWEREAELIQIIMQIIYTYMSEGVIDYSKAWYGLTNYNDTILFEVGFKFAISMLPKAFTMWIAGKDYKSLVGEYVV